MIASKTKKFIEAASNGNLQLVRDLLDSGAVEINSVNEFGQTALIECCKPRFRDVVNPGFRPSYEVRSPEEVVHFLLENRADPAIRENSGYSAIHHAAQFGKEEIIKSILARSPELVNEKVGDWTPLFFAVRFNKLEAARTLIEHGADINAEISAGDKTFTVFDYANRIASSSDREEMLTLLNSQKTVFGLRNVSAEQLISRERSVSK